MKRLAWLLMFASSLAWGAPFVISGPLTAGVTQCGVFLDSAAKTTISVTAVTTPTVSNICKFDVGGVSAGSHTITMTSITTNDPVWGSQESVQSVPFQFSRPLFPAAPNGLLLTP